MKLEHYKTRFVQLRVIFPRIWLLCYNFVVNYEQGVTFLDINGVSPCALGGCGVYHG